MEAKFIKGNLKRCRVNLRLTKATSKHYRTGEAKEVLPHACSVLEAFPITSAINYCHRKETGLCELIIPSKAAVL